MSMGDQQPHFPARRQAKLPEKYHRCPIDSSFCQALGSCNCHPRDSLKEEAGCRRSFMRARVLLGICSVCVSVLFVVTVQSQQNPPDAPSADSSQAKANAAPVEGTVVSTTRHTLV